MDNIGLEDKDIVVAKPKKKRWIHSDPNSVCYFLDLVNRIDSLQRAVAQVRGENHRLMEEIRAAMQREPLVIIKNGPGR